MTNTPEGMLDSNACVVKKLKHENVIPIYIENVCIGYYYLEFGIEDITTNNIINSSTFPAHQHDTSLERDEMLMKILSAKISSGILTDSSTTPHVPILIIFFTLK